MAALVGQALEEGDTASDTRDTGLLRRPSFGSGTVVVKQYDHGTRFGFSLRLWSLGT